MRVRTPLSHWRARLPGRRGWAALAAAVTVLGLVVAALAGAFSPAQPGSQASRIRSSNAALTQPAAAHSGQPARPGAATRTGTAGAGKAQAGAAQAGGHGQAAQRTSCTAVAHIGDSTSVGMVDPAVLPDPARRLQARYTAVGVRHALVDASGGRSIVEEMPGQVNGYRTAQAMASHGFHGCWVFALGTNDTADVATGSAEGRLARIEQMMSVAHGQPVLWVSTRTLDTTGYWSEANMRLWNAALQQACARYPNMRVYDWAAAAQPGWYITDGIHYTAAGYAARAQAIAGALATAFPANGHSSGCLIR